VTETSNPSAALEPLSLAIQTVNIRKEYVTRGSKNRFVAVGDLTLSVPRGQVFGFLGPNGAGKTTTINMLLGNANPTSGEGQLLGKPLGDVDSRARIGFLPEKFQFHDFLTASEFLDIHGRLYGMSSKDRKSAAITALERVGLASRRNDRLGEFSKGMQQRAGLAQAILNNPELVILDEPTSALDPLGRRDVRNLISELKAEGVTVFLNSHLLSEIEMTCDQVAIIKQGIVIRQGTIDNLLGESLAVELRVGGLTDSLRADIRSLSGSDLTDLATDRLSLMVKSETVIPEIARLVVNSGASLLAMTPVRESLEELFIRVVEEK
jgi:ABC-2 type transport system ATP-binding protein